MEIKKGYKMTDVGVIPEDWEVKSIGEIFSSLRSASITKEMFVEKGCMCVHYGDIHTKYGRILDCDKDVIPNVPISLCKNYPNVEDGDIIMADASEDLEGVGKCVSVINTRGRDIISGLHTILLRDRNNSFYNSFPTYMFSCENVKKGIESYAVGTKVNSISYNSIKDCQFCYPSKKEQQAIADALTKVDNLIMSLSKVIEKKKLIKKGAMQKLLSGEMRLDGFEGEWIKIKLGDISSIKTGSRNVEEHSANGKYPFFVRSKEVMKINTFSYDEEAILVPGEGGIGEIFHYVNGKFDVHQRVYKISDFNDKVNALFIYWYMIIFFGEYAKENTVKATVDSLRLPTFTDFICCLPPTKAEQTAIAKVLTTMDDEIEALEKERDKYKCIKQGMMQQLLTGKIRLICQ